MTALSVNVNKIATLRNARGGKLPDVVQCSYDILNFGAHGITVHPRPDERHIRKHDVFDLHKMIRDWNQQKNDTKEFNIEGYPSPDFLELIEEVRPDQCTLVPDPPHVLTSNAGWKMATNEDLLKQVTTRLKKAGVRVSLFVDVFDWSESEAASLSRIRPDRVELYTEKYASAFGSPEEKAVTERYSQVAREMAQKQIEINAGHDLNLSNLRSLIVKIPEIAEVSIGHALISEALYLGFQETIRRYLQELEINRT